MSRFQLLVFTFVVSLSLFLVVVSHAKMAQIPENASHPESAAQLPDIPGGILALLGISASSYTVSKAIQTNVPKKTE